MQNTIFITGAAQRIGLALAQHLQQQGFRLIISYRTPHPSVAELTAAGVCCIQAELTCLHSLAHLIEQIRAYTPTLRAVIHNASAWQKDPAVIAGTPLLTQLQQDAAVFTAMSDVHSRAAYLLNRALLPLLQAQGAQGLPADIIHLTDFVASVGSEKHQAYAASRAATENLTLSLARQLAPAIKVNAIAPALLMFNAEDNAEYRQQALSKSLLQKEPGAAEVLAAVDYLLQSQYVTGRILALDGGRHLRLP